MDFYYHYDFSFDDQITQQYLDQTICRNKKIETEQEEFKLPRIEIEDIVNKQEIILFLEELKCPICLDIIEDAKTCIQCEANFCGVCIKNILRDGYSKCPMCRYKSDQNIRITQNIFNSMSNVQFERGSKLIKKLLSTIQIVCPNDGCSSIVNYDQRINHLKECKYYFVKCKNNGCLEMLNEFAQKEHDKVCIYKQESCQYCQNEFLLQELFKHEENCEENKQLCSEFDEFDQTQNIDQHQTKMIAITRNIAE